MTQRMLDKQSEDRSFFVSEVLSAPPPYLVRSGAIILLALVFICVIISLFLPLRTQINVPGELMSADLPAELRARREGRLTNIKFQDGDWVDAGEVIAAIDGDGVRADIEMVRAWLAELKSNLDFTGQSEMLPLPDALVHINLGTVGPAFQDAVAATSELNRFILSDEYRLEIAHLREAREARRNRIAALSARETVRRDGVVSAEGAHRRIHDAFEKGLTTAIAFETAQRQLLVARDELLQTQEEIKLNEEAIAEHTRLVSEKELRRSAQFAELTDAIRVAIYGLDTQIANWSSNNEFIAPFSGYARFFQVWSDHQFVATGDVVVVLEPPRKVYSALAYVPSARSGKIAPGQLAMFSLDSHSDIEFGRLRGRVHSISALNRDGKRRVVVHFADGMTTTTGNKLDFSQNASGLLKIVTEDMVLFERVFYTLRHGFNV